MLSSQKIKFPEGKKFAFSIIDDTDVSTCDSIKPIYELLEKLGLRTSKTIWVKKCNGKSKNFFRSETMEDRKYANLVSYLSGRGFEICFHGASMESSPREFIAGALQEFKSFFGCYPRIHINHAENRDNLYWGAKRFNSPLLRFIYELFNWGTSSYFTGDEPSSAYFWGDICERWITYVRNFCYDEINLLNINPSMPYHNPRCRFVNLWFSGVEGFDPWSFNKILRPSNLDKLERQGGVCIVGTHFGKYFVKDGKINEGTKRVLENLSQRSGWFVPVSNILDYLYEHGGRGRISRKEILRMEYKWIWYRIKKRNGIEARGLRFK